MTDRILLQLTLNIRAESLKNGDPLCVHGGIVKVNVDPENIDEAKKSLVGLLYDAANVVKKIGGTEH